MGAALYFTVHRVSMFAAPQGDLMVSDARAPSPAPTVHWPAFTLGVVTGLSLAAAALVLAVLAQRANRRSRTTGTRVGAADPLSAERPNPVRSIG